MSNFKSTMRLSDKIFKGEHNQEKYSHADYNLIFENKIIEDIEIETLDIGKLNVPSGQIVVCDPLALSDISPLNKTVPPGKYPVIIYVAKTKESGDRYAIAKLEFSPIKAEKWVLALRDGEDISTLEGDDDFFGFPVDAGVGGFFDYQAGLELNNFFNEFFKANPKRNIYDDFFAAEFKKNAVKKDAPYDIGDWINFRLPESELNITMFHSGYGDGTYPAYWGMTKENEIVSLVIDFHVLLLPDK